MDEYYKLTVRERQNRYFSAAIKRKKVSEIDRNLTSVAEVSREYQVSRTSVHRWINKYSQMRKKGVKQVVEPKSDTRKLLQLKDQVKELERTVGQKQIKIDFLEKMIDLVEEQYNIDIKKKATIPPSAGSGSTGKNTSTK
ncbi:MAG: transposase [Bacteroidetes bacterium]|nr:transposase [Bacteroidota bacterium]